MRRSPHRKYGDGYIDRCALHADMGNQADNLRINSDAGRAFEDASVRLVALQLRLATHWRVVIHSAVERFAARVEISSVHSLSVDELMKVYEVWIDCAEKAYADVVSTEEYCRVQAELVNTALGMLLQARAEASGSRRT